MSKQKGIMAFFKPVATKRSCGGSDMTTTKKIKLDNESEPDAKNHFSDQGFKKLLTLIDDFKILDKDMGISWFNALEQEFSKPYFKTLNNFILEERKSFKIYPLPENVWSWTKLCTLREVKVVIIGQDPYHNPRQAHGLCFSVQRGISIPPSLINIYKELETDIPGFKAPNHGNLTKWAEQGVLLLNASLTVREHAPNSHSDKGWEKITDAAIKAVSDKNHGVVFLLWGAFAQKKVACVDKKKHHLLFAPHPSPLSASRGFFGCKHFSKCNEILKNSGKLPVDWNLD